MSAESLDVFFYGLFMDADLFEAKGLRPRDPRRARIEGYGLRIGERATLVPAADEMAHGVVMALTEDELARLYAEPSVSDYRSELVEARLDDGRPLTVACYLLPKELAGGEVNRQYAAELAELVRRLELPAEYVAEIERLRG